MGSRIIVPGYFGDKGLGFDPLVRRGLKYLNFYGEADKTGRNLAPDGVAATVLGVACCAGKWRPVYACRHIA
ncbi:hypothetical protein ACYB0K_28215 [Klebsiella pneumoniae]